MSVYLVKSKSALLIKVIVSLGLLVWVAGRLDTDALLAAILRADPWIFLAACGFVLVQYAIGTLRWYVLGRLTGASLSVWQTIRLFMAAVFFNQVLPTSIGGDAVRAWLASRQGIPLSRAASSVVLDRSAGLISLLFLMLLTGALFADAMPNPTMATLVRVAPVCIVIAIVIGLATAETTARLFDRWRFTAPISIVLRDSGALWRRGRGSALVFAISFCIHFLNATSLWLIARAIGLEIDYITLVGFLPPVILMMALPISIAGWGVREGVMVMLFTLLGQSGEAGLAASLLWGGALLAASVACGAVWFVTRAPNETLSMTEETG